MNKIINKFKNTDYINILGYIFIFCIFSIIFKDILSFYSFNFTKEIHQESRYQEVFLIFLKDSKALLCLSLFIVLYVLIKKNISLFIIGILTLCSYLISDLIFKLFDINDYYSQKELIVFLCIANFILFLSYIKTKNKYQLFIFISTTLVILTTIIINISIDYSFYKYVELNEVIKLETLENKEFDCEKNNCLIYNSSGFENIKGNNNVLLGLVSDELKKEIKKFDIQNEKQAIALIIRTKTYPILVGLMKKDSEINVFLDDKKLKKLKTMSRIYVNFLITVASTFWIFIMHILLYYHNNKKIRKLI